ncbi:M56 family metallopeptidase [Pseudoflavonifractor phocaeensis]|uniref:M56 family metallopeptidase n=1 Tax=Pseudoflavonifractor phocaeensis TaxID=1870988 RepID=UPI00195BEEE8|nr:M56 family metallopeptidase [Pseudoflavonifractor phocaeensis]MBM6924435.1 M56 family metallopeptidase [Pseudoflavonifractor phocaeensis]
MENIWSFLLQTLTASVAAAVLLIAKRLFLDKLSPRWQYGIWAILALRLLLPAGLLGRSLLPLGRVTLEAAKASIELPLASALTDPYGVTAVTAPIPLVRLVPPASVTDWLFFLYAAGVAVTLLWFFLSYLALGWRVAGGRSPSPQALEQVATVAARYGLKAPRRVVVLPGVESAFVCGPLSPVLVLPEWTVDDKVILHELLHLKYGDLWAGVAMCALRCLHWCNPLLWYCWDQAQNDCESLCDQRVLERLEGEERRQYGVILLSMADDKYARAPGTTSMANGGQHIKARIQAIARFKRYPRGMGLASGCVAAVLAIACLAGSGQAAEVPDPRESGSIPLAAARLNRPTTVAGALDTYAKGVLSNSPLYLYMAAPAEAQAELFGTASQSPNDNGMELDRLFDQLDFWMSSGTRMAQWSVMNLLPDGDGGYTGALFFLPLEGTSTEGGVTQQVAVRPDGAFWTVEPLNALEVWSGEDLWLCPSQDTPYVTYRAEAAGVTLEIDVQCRLWVSQQYPYATQLFTPHSAMPDHTAQPHAAFGGMRDGYGLRTDPAVERLRCAPMTQGQDPAAVLDKASYWVEMSQGSLEDDHILASAGSYEGEDLGLRAMPEALAVRFTCEGREYTCTALLKEVVP